MSAPRDALDLDELGLPASPPCAFCGGSETELFSPFGGQLSTATYWCRSCHTSFEWFKWSPPREDAPPGGG